MASFEGSIGTPSGKFNLMVEYSVSQSISGNYSDVSATAYVKRNDSNYWPYNGYGGDGNLSIDGDNKYERVAYDLRTDGYKQIMSHSKRVYHNSDGTKSINISFSFDGRLSNGYPNGSISQTVSLPTIPRYANITSFSVSKVDETSVQFNFSTDVGCDWAWYSTDGGSTWANLDGNTGIVYGLSANTWYAFKLRVRRTDSGLTTDSDVVWQQTYDYPYISSTPNFDIGNQMSIGIYNPLNRNCQVYIIASDNSTMGGDTTTGTSISGYYNSGWQNFWYASIPNSSSGDYRVRLVVSSLGRDTTVSGGRYYAKENECKALLSMSVVDTNSDITTLLGSNTKFLRYLSKPQVVLTPTTRYGSSIVGQTISLGDGQYAYSLTHTFNKIDSNYVSGTVRDSRGFYTTVDTTLDMVDYIKLAITKFILSKPEGTSDEVKITLEGNWFNDDFVENTPNTLNINLDYKLATSSTWTNYGTLTPTITGNTFKITNLSLGNIYDFDKEYQFKVTITDLVDEISDIEAIRGQEVIAIGDGKIWLYGDVYKNDRSVLVGYTLYSSNGEMDTITLSDNVSNYEYLEIYYYDYDNSYYSIKTDIRGDVVMQTTAINLNNSGYYIKMNRYSISGNQLVYVESAEVSSVTDNRIFYANTNYTKVRIYKVIGYK